MKAPVRVAVTGAAGQIGYSLLFRIANGDMLGSEQPVRLQLLEIPNEKVQKALRGVMMEIEDCAFPLLTGMIATDDPRTSFRDCDIALLVGARPRGPGMERKDLLAENAKIFIEQGRALNDSAKSEVRVLVVGNPANTNAWIAMKNAPRLGPENFTAMMRLDHNRAASLIAAKVGRAVGEIRRVTIWGNHSATQYPDLFHAQAGSDNVWPLINDQAWLENTFIPTVQKRGAAIIEARGASSAASAANAAIDHVRDWVQGTRDGDWVSMGVPSDGSYGIPEGVIYGCPVICRRGKYERVQGIDVSAFSRARMDATYKELLEERDAVKNLIA